LLFLTATCFAEKQASAAAASAPQSATLESVLSQMDAAASGFRTAQAQLDSQQYQKVVDETDTQSGEVYFSRRGGALQMKLNISKPDEKYVLVKDGKAQLYQPSIDQLTEYSLNSSQNDEGMFSLGFGGRGHDLLKSFHVKLAGSETIDGVATEKLELVPKSPKVLNMFSRITIWIDPKRDVSLQQQFDEPSGDWRKAHYTNIKLNSRIPENVFTLKTTPKTQVVHP
jgi:outer membrane lipoprotein-sorting protein